MEKIMQYSNCRVEDFTEGDLYELSTVSLSNLDHISILLKNDLVDPNLINAMEDHIEVYGMKGCKSDYFSENYIRLWPEKIDEGIILFDGEHYEEEIDYKEYEEVYYFVEEHWEPLLNLEFH
jgi:hypothetical protein